MAKADGRLLAWGACVRAAALVLGLGAATATAAAADLPSFDQVRARWRTSDTLVLDRHGVAVQAVRTDPRARRLAWVPLSRISPALRESAVLAEDRDFRRHAGVDWGAAANAALGRLGPDGTRGASTITMQLAGLIDPALALPPGGRSVPTKIAQASAALQIERTWTKDQILEAWLNLVPFRGELVGVGAMSEGLFQKDPSGLDAQESAIAAALLRAPNAPPAQVGARACPILQAMKRNVKCETTRGLAELLLSRAPNVPADPSLQLAPHFARQVLAISVPLAPQASASSPGTPAAPARIRTTLDAGLQRVARDALRNQLSELRDRGVADGAVVVLDNETGDVVAWVGSSGDLSSAADVDAVVARRQAGSTLKPFLYELALERRWLTAASILPDTPERLQTGDGLYIPQDYDHRFKGRVSVRTALASSLNVPAVRALVMVGPDAFARRLEDLGVHLDQPGDHYGYSLALGSAEVDLLSLTNGYRALAAGGRVSPPRLLASSPRVAPRPVMDSAATFVVADILADNGARVPTFGLDSVLATRFRTSVKTGTSKDMRDNWCVGFDTHYTVGVWVGNAGGDPMRDVSGVTGAAPIWRSVIEAVHRREPAITHDARPAQPAGLERRDITFEDNLEARRTEWFLAGTAQTKVVFTSAAGLATRWIASPEDRSIIALDPDIPPASQRLRFEIATGRTHAATRWRLDGHIIASASKPFDWQPWPGRHELALVDAHGQPLDTVKFEVRGAELKPGTPPPPQRKT
jgi:penicillin-binding protein 1C